MYKLLYMTLFWYFVYQDNIIISCNLELERNMQKYDSGFMTHSYCWNGNIYDKLLVKLLLWHLMICVV